MDMQKPVEMRSKISRLDRRVVKPERSAVGSGVGSADSSDSAEERERCGQLIALAEAQFRRGEKDAAEKSLLEAEELAERSQDLASLTRIVLVLPAWHWPGPGEANPLARILAQRGLAIERDDGRSRAILMARLAAEVSYDLRQREYCAELGDSAMEQVRVNSDPRSELYVRLYRDQVLRQPERLAERLTNAEETLRLAIEARDYGACCVAGLAVSGSLTMIGDMAAADHAAEFTIGIAPTSQVQFHNALPAAYRTHRAVMDGRLADALQDFERCVALAEEYKFPYLFDACWPMMLIPYSEGERLSELESVAEETVRRRPSVLIFSVLLSWIKVQVGRAADASFLLERLAADEFANLATSAEGLVGMAMLAEVCAALNRPDYAAILYKQLLPWTDLNATINAFAVFGSVERYVGILAVVLERTDEAIGHFEQSLRRDRRSGARPWAIYSGLELVSNLARRGTAKDRERALELLHLLEAEADGLKMKRALSKLIESRDELSGARVVAPGSWETATTRILEPLIEQNKNGSKRAAESVAPRRSASAGKARGSSDEHDPPNDERVAMFCRNGDYWVVGYEGRTSSFSDRQGLKLLCFLVQHPEREFFALELTHQGEADVQARHSEDRQIADGSSAAILDAEAKRSYRERLREIRSELDELYQTDNVDGAAKLETEQDFLTRELASAMGLFGRDRKFGSESERARKRVSIAIRRALTAISRHEEHLGRHLERSIRTGNLCRYTPDPGNPVRWRV